MVAHFFLFLCGLTVVVAFGFTKVPLLTPVRQHVVDQGCCPTPPFDTLREFRSSRTFCVMPGSLPASMSVILYELWFKRRFVSLNTSPSSTLKGSMGENGGGRGRAGTWREVNAIVSTKHR